MLWGHKLGAQLGVDAKVLVSHGHGALIAFWLLGWERQVPAEPFGMMPVLSPHAQNEGQEIDTWDCYKLCQLIICLWCLCVETALGSGLLFSCSEADGVERREGRSW